MKTFPILAAAVLMMAGCATTSFVPSTVEGTLVSNPSLGFRGVTMSAPVWYQPYQPEPKQEVYPDLNFAQLAWHMSTDYAKYAGHQAVEHLVFESEYLGIAVAFVQIASRVPPKERRIEQEAFLDRSLRAMRFPTGNVTGKEVRVIGDNRVACFRRELVQRGRYNGVYIVPMPPSGVIVFNGACLLEDQDVLTKDMEAMLATLKVN